VFDLVPPASAGDTARWAETNADRMTSFGYNAVKAPAMPDPITTGVA
jgi:hypothetical protein